jgi:hypothetical protein
MSLLGVIERVKKVDEEELEDDYEYNDDRPNLDPVDRPTDERGDRPTRAPVSPRWGPRRGNTR